MLSFDESKLKKELQALEPKAQLAFALAVSQRQFNGLSRVPSSTRGVEDILMELWRVSTGGTSWPPEQWWIDASAEVERHIPADSKEKWSVWTPFFEDALTSLLYALAFGARAQTQDVVWAARRGFEASYEAAIAISETQGDPTDDALLRQHPIVQRELGRQYDDVMRLKSGAVDQVKAHSSECLLTNSELQALQ